MDSERLSEFYKTDDIEIKEEYNKVQPFLHNSAVVLNIVLKFNNWLNDSLSARLDLKNLKTEKKNIRHEELSVCNR